MRVLNQIGRFLIVPALLGTTVCAQGDAPFPKRKRVEINKATQEMRAYEDGRLVLATRVSTGRYDRSTPNGTFAAGDKFRMHYSRLYHQAPMPFSVQVNGNVFVHGFAEVPPYPASHGCIRVPLDHGNPARAFYEWVDSGTPIIISGHWGDSRAH